MTTMNRMDIGEFRAEGYLQEINRRVLHPLGLAIAVDIGSDGSERLGDIWDYRDDPEGIRYEDVNLATKADRVTELWIARQPARLAALGYMIQPVMSDHK